MNNTQYMAELKYNVGDRVQIKSLDWFRNEGANMVVAYMTKYYGEVVTIKSVHKGFYRIKEDGGQYCWIDEMFECKMDKESIIDLTVKGEEVKERIEIAIPEGYEYIIESGKIIFTKKKKEYPKTFEECVSVLMCKGGNRMPLELMNTFRKLIDARNAYWMIYGEENGLGKPWEPDWTIDDVKYSIFTIKGMLSKTRARYDGAILSFPTEEMRDAFYENFKKEIEICKELL